MTENNLKFMNDLRSLLVEFRSLEDTNAKLAKTKPEYSSYFLAEQTGMMRNRVALEVLMTQHGFAIPRTHNGETIDVGHLCLLVNQQMTEPMPD